MTVLPPHPGGEPVVIMGCHHRSWSAGFGGPDNSKKRPMSAARAGVGPGLASRGLRRRGLTPLRGSRVGSPRDRRAGFADQPGGCGRRCLLHEPRHIGDALRQRAGLANGVANLHNARRAGTPVVNIVGAHATGHVRLDAPLQSDIEAMARTVSGWVHTSGTPRELAGDAMRAVEAAGRLGAGQVATLVLPADVSWSEGAAVAPSRPPAPLGDVPGGQVEAAAQALDDGTLILLGGRALTERGLRAASRVSRATGARLLAETFPAR